MAEPHGSRNLMDRPPGVQCTARSKTTGQRCQRPALLGGNVCRSHGGNAPQTRAKAQRRLEQAADVLVQRLLRFALDGDVDDAVALRAIIAAIDRAGFAVTTKVAVGPDTEAPWEKLFAGLATYGGSDADDPADTQTALALSGAAADSADVIDAEVVEPDAERPAEPRTDAQRGDVPRAPKWAQYGEPPLRSKPRGELVTMEDAVAEQGRDPATRPRKVRSRRV